MRKELLDAKEKENKSQDKYCGDAKELAITIEDMHNDSKNTVPIGIITSKTFELNRVSRIHSQNDEFS